MSDDIEFEEDDGIEDAVYNEEGQHVDTQDDLNAVINEQVQELIDHEDSKAWRKVLSMPEGRMAIWSILCEAGLHTTTFTGDRTGDFLEGRRDMGNWVLGRKVFTAGRKWYTMMGDEAEERDARIKEIKERRGYSNAT
tara:strand:+ start:235 stop:648 length:414 start_codon:yes stop_codon:yes gene_type:complete